MAWAVDEKAAPSAVTGMMAEGWDKPSTFSVNTESTSVSSGTCTVRVAR